MVARLDDRPQQAAVISAVRAVVDALGVSFVAAGVESPEQVATLRSLGCHLMQGAGVVAPMAADDVPIYLV